MYFSSVNNIYSFNTKSHKYNTIPNIHSSLNYALAKSPDGNIWLGTLGNGLYYKPQSSNTFLSVSEINDKLPDNLYILSLHVDRFDRLWVCTLEEGIFLLNLKHNTLEKLKFQKGNLYALSDNEIFDLYEDKNGVIWLGTNVSGLAYYDEYLSKFNVLTSNQTPEGTSVETVIALASDDANNIYIGKTSGLTIFNTNTKEFKTFTQENSQLPNNNVNTLNFNGDQLWIGNGLLRGENGGLSVLDKNGDLKKINLYFEDNQEVTYVNPVFFDSNGICWLGTERGLVKWERQNNTVNKVGNSLDKEIEFESKLVRSIIEDEKGYIYFATRDNEIFKVNLITYETTLVTSKFSQIKCIQFSPSHKDILWIGTNGSGLIAYNIKTLKSETFSYDNGLPDNVIYGILSDNNNNLWLSTNKGITRFLYNSESDIEIETYGVNDGLQGLEFNTDAYYKDSDGVLYFGGLNGINWFHPASINKNPNLPKTNISEVTVLNNVVDFSVNNVFSYDQNTISFGFESLNFSKPEGNSFKYRLVNHHNEWIESGTSNEARYVNLPPNDYTFEVISSNYDGIWNTIPATYSFTILEPWYLNNFAKFVYFLLTILIIYGIYRYFKWRWHMRMQLELESRETARWKKLDEFKTKLYNNISHEFRTPLTLISGPVENQLVKPNISENDKIELNLIKRNSKRLLNLVNQLLDLSKLETGNLKLLVSKGNLTVLLKQLATAFEFKAKEKGITFSYDIADIEEAWFDRDVIEKIVSNLLNNAVKYAPKNGYVSFLTTLNEGYLTITVINNGNHLKDEDLPKLFQRYYQNDKHSEGVGIGLSLVKELTVLSHGNVVAHTMNTDDIQFVVSLPIERSYFNAMEIVDTNFDRELSEDTLDLEDETMLEFHKDNEKPLLLIVEDDEDIRTFVKSIFKADYKIVETQDGEVGIKKALQHIPDVIVSDVMMPKVDGIELCNTLKEDFKTSHIPIILLTAKSGDHNEIEGLKTGADAYITKPFNSEKLKIRVEKLIATRKKLQAYYGKNNALDFHNLKVSKTDEQFFNNLQEAIKEDLVQTDFTSEKLSKLMYMSRMQLHRKLKALLGLSTSEFIRNERLKLAISLLEKSDSTISEIAYQTGFNAPTYFMKCFKEVYHCTPTEYLESINK
jgi:signal transduction histidine kinase/DNA-binding response OmpR family regulator/ligand-binding sensor domain-containing protein